MVGRRGSKRRLPYRAGPGCAVWLAYYALAFCPFLAAFAFAALLGCSGSPAPERRVMASIIQVSYRHTYKRLDQSSIEHYPSTVLRITLPFIAPVDLVFIGQRTDYLFFGVDIPATNTLVREVYVKEPGGWAVEPVPAGWTSEWKLLGEWVSLDAPAFLNMWGIVLLWKDDFYPLFVGAKSWKEAADE